MFRSGDKLTITYKNGAKTYIYDSDTETFLNNGVELEESENYFIGWHDDQSYENQWSPSDSSNAHIYVTYMGRTSNPVSLKFEQTIEVPEIDNDSFTYNGKPQGPEVAASNAYTVSGAKQTNAGEYTVTLTCNDGYIFETGSTVETFDWWINPLEIEKPAGKLLTYSGKAQVGVAQGEGYEVSGNIATNAGKYVAQVACDNNHVFASGETRAEIPYEIAKANISKAIVVLDKNSSPYTGKLQKGTVKSVTLGLDTLVEGTDYIVNAKSGTAAKQYSVTVTGKGNYTGSVSATFVVTKVSISSVGMQNCVYKGEANLPAPVPTVKAGSNVLKNATDFTYSVAYNKGHDNGKYVGPATVTVTGKGNCTGKIVKNFKITTVADSKTVGAKLNEKTLSAIEKVKTGAGAVKQANSDTMETIAKPRAKTMTVKWKKVDGATNYIVGYKRSTDKNWSYVVSGGKTEYTFSKMAEGGLLEFRVAVYDGTKFARSEWTRINCRFYREMVSLKAVAGKGKISLNWGKVSGATGYQVLIATKENMSDAETVSVEGGSALKYTVMKYGKSKLKAGKTYYVKVRPIKYEANALGKKNTYVGINSLARKCSVE